MMVAAVCLYTAARQNEKCTVMMIDFADACSVSLTWLNVEALLTLIGQCIQTRALLQKATRANYSPSREACSPRRSDLPICNQVRVR